VDAGLGEGIGDEAMLDRITATFLIQTLSIYMPHDLRPSSRFIKHTNIGLVSKKQGGNMAVLAEVKFVLLCDHVEPMIQATGGRRRARGPRRHRRGRVRGPAHRDDAR
jgi:hypothetical protein